MRSLRAALGLSLIFALACGGADPAASVETDMAARWGGTFTATSSTGLSNEARGFTPMHRVTLTWSRAPGEEIEVRAALVDGKLSYAYDELQTAAYEAAVAHELEPKVPGTRITPRVSRELGSWRPKDPIAAPLIADQARYPDAFANIDVAVARVTTPEELAGIVSTVVETWRGWGGGNLVVGVAMYDPAEAGPLETLTSYAEDPPRGRWRPAGLRGAWEVRAERTKPLPLTAADLVVWNDG